MMSRNIICFMVAALLSACGHHAVSGPAGNSSDTDSLAVDSLGAECEDSVATIIISAFWPTAPASPLADSVRRFIVHELFHSASGVDREVAVADGQKMVETAMRQRYDDFAAQRSEMTDAGIPVNMPYNYSQHIGILAETARYVTYHSFCEGFEGGAHGYATSVGMTFRKSDGLPVGYVITREDNGDDERRVFTRQNLFRDPSAPGLYAVVKEGVRSYFQSFDDQQVDDVMLQEQLIGVSSVDSIPLPQYSPYFTSDGLVFLYEQYEIAPYVAGMICFTVPYDRIRPFLTDEALGLTE